MRTQEPSSPTTGATPAAPAHTGSVTTRVLGVVVLVGSAILLYLALVGTAPDSIQLEAMRLMYAHVPVVSVAYTACFVCTAASIGYLIRRTEWWDLVAASAAEIGTVFLALTLVTGMVWGKPTWGVFWVWDPRLTSTAMLMLLLLGYLAVRSIPADPVVRGRRSAVLGLLLLPNVFIVNKSVEWWRSVHQQATVFRLDHQPLDDLMKFTISLGSVVGLVLFAWLMIHRFRVAYLQDRVDEAGLEDALVERRAERTAPLPTEPT